MSIPTNVRPFLFREGFSKKCQIIGRFCETFVKKILWFLNLNYLPESLRFGRLPKVGYTAVAVAALAEY